MRLYIKMTVKFIYRDVHEIDESQLPANWNETNIASFGRIHNFYSEGIKEEQKERPTSAATDEVLAQILRGNSYDSILDVGIADGDRLSQIIKKSGREVRGLGTELSDEMIELARRKGFDVKKHDMRHPLPFGPESIDCIAYLTGDFGYLMGQQRGADLRVSTLNSIYLTLRPSGTLFAEMVSDNTIDQGRDGRVLVYTRIPIVDGIVREDLAGKFYLKKFTFNELKKLVEASNFDPQKSEVRYQVWHTGQNSGIQAGQIVRTYPSFQGFDPKQIQPSGKDLQNLALYKMFLIARK